MIYKKNFQEKGESIFPLFIYKYQKFKGLNNSVSCMLSNTLYCEDFMSLSFSIPVYAEKSQRMHYSRLKQCADNYFYFGKYQARILQASGKNIYQVEIEKSKPTRWYITGLKVFSFGTGFIPLTFLAIHLHARHRKSFQVTNTQINKNVTPVDSVELNKKFDAIFLKAGVNPQQATALQKHVVFFAEENTGNLTQKSIRRGLNRLHIPKIVSFIGAKVIFSSLRGKLEKNERKNFLRMQDIAKIGKHSNDSGVYNANGDFDENQFEALKKFAQPNCEFLTASDIKKMRKSNTQKDKGSTLAGKVASLGEFGLALRLFGDRIAVNQKGNTNPAISFERLRMMYEEGPHLIFEQVALQKKS